MDKNRTKKMINSLSFLLKFFKSHKYSDSLYDDLKNIGIDREKQNLLFDLLSKIKDNEQITIKNKNRDSIEDITHFHSRDEIESIFSKYNDSEIAHNFNKMIINDMYNTVFDCKPLSRTTKSDNIKEIRHLFYSIKRTKDMLQPSLAY